MYDIDFNCLKDKENIKILICYILNNIKFDLTKDIIIFCLQNSKIANFFDLNNAFSELLDSEIIIVDLNNKIKISDKGILVNETLNESLSQNIKNKAISAILEYVKNIKNIKENNVEIEKNSSGYSIKCSISGGDFDLMNLSVFAPDIESALSIKRNFYKNIEEIYSSVLSKLIINEKSESDNSCFVI